MLRKVMLLTASFLLTCSPASLAAPVQTVASGEDHSCAVTASGGVECWGSDQSGQLGDAAYDETTGPVAVSAITNAVAVDAGQKHSCALLATGRIKCWGNGGNGQLGAGNILSAPVPVDVQDIADATAIAVGETHTCAIVSGGAIKCWGWNEYGEVGDGTLEKRNTPVAVGGISGAVSLSAGDDFTCAVVTDGKVFCWGYGNFGQLGHGSQVPQQKTPVQVSNITSATSVAVGGSNSCALLTGGTVKCWGAGSSGQLGNGQTNQQVKPVDVTGISGALAVTVGGNYSCALLVDKTVKCWGNNKYRQLGSNGDTGLSQQNSTPVVVSGASDIVSISGGTKHVCAVQQTGAVLCWGAGAKGQLGNGTPAIAKTPVLVKDMAGFSAIGAGENHTCAASSDTMVYCWGEKGEKLAGVAGGGPTGEDQELPARVGRVGATAAIVAGKKHTCLLRTNGWVVCSGKNDKYQVGGGSNVDHANGFAYVDRYWPKPTEDISDATKIAAGDNHTCVVVTDGKVKCWGDATKGQLGNSEPKSATLPKLAANITGARACCRWRSHLRDRGARRR